MRVWGRLAGLVAGILMIATPASAQALWPGGPGSTTPIEPGKLFVGLGAQFEVYNLPKFDSPYRNANSDGSDLWRPSWDPDPTVVGPGGVLGYVFRDGAFPSWAGRKVRLSFGAQFWDGTANDRQSRSTGFIGGTASVRASAAPIDGSPGTQISVICPCSLQRQASFAVRATGYHLSLRLTSDYRVDTNVTLSPFVAVFGGRSFDSYSLRAGVTAPQFSLGVFPYALDERVATNRIGAMVGTGLTVPLDRRKRIRVHLGVQAGFVWLRSHMTGGDCFAGSSIPAIGTACGAALVPGGFQTSVSDTRSTVGFRGGLTGGVTWDMHFAILSLTGFMSYDSQVPGIRNPVVTAPLTTNGLKLPTSGRAHLFFDDAVDFGGMVVLRIPLDAPHG